jgi:hypothetical protein
MMPSEDVAITIAINVAMIDLEIVFVILFTSLVCIWLIS